MASPTIDGARAVHLGGVDVGGTQLKPAAQSRNRHFAIGPL
jgi:hypothetical protein